MFAVGLYDFEGTNDPNELHFHKDDIIELLSNEGDWLRARLNGKTGIVPKNYIKILDDVKPATNMQQRAHNVNDFSSAEPRIENGIDVSLLQQFVSATSNLNENQPIPANVMNTYPLVKEEYGKLSKKVSDLQQEQDRLLELHSKMVHANQLYDQLMEYQMISKMNLS
eukprot:NODE_97_length_21155_cov_0.234850.p14 type:complete len:168 gc:universal NODE_97_length_21155_cov_0.234850:1118-615(-)